MKNAVRLYALLAIAIFPSWVLSQTPKLVDAHVHHNGDPEFLKQLVAKLDSVDGLALLITAPNDLGQVTDFIKQHPNRLICLG